MDEQRQRWLIEGAPALADELARLPFLPETGGDAHLNVIIPTLRALVAATAARQAQDEMAREIVQAVASMDALEVRDYGDAQIALHALITRAVEWAVRESGSEQEHPQ